MQELSLRSTLFLHNLLKVCGCTDVLECITVQEPVLDAVINPTETAGASYPFMHVAEGILRKMGPIFNNFQGRLLHLVAVRHRKPGQERVTILKQTFPAKAGLTHAIARRMPNDWGNGPEVKG